MLVRSLDELTAADLPEAGGKGANLGELRRAGFPVPDGFVITTAAYALAAEAAGVTGENPATARVRLAATSVPAGIADAVREAYGALGAPAGAGRSVAAAGGPLRPGVAASAGKPLHIHGARPGAGPRSANTAP